MHEVEIKAVLKDGPSIRAKLEALGCTFSAPIQQEDAVYVENMGDLPTFLANRAFLRIRVNNGKQILFTAKAQGRVSMAPLEHEVEVNSKEELEGMLAMMGYTLAVRVTKERTQAKYNGCEICLDEVEGLGSFIEMEKMSDDDPAAIQEDLFKFFETLGVSRADRITKGYDILVLEKQNL